MGSEGEMTTLRKMMEDAVSESTTTADNGDEINLCRKVAHIVGPSSGAAQACAKYDELTAVGVKPVVVNAHGRWVVFPTDPSP